MHAQLLDSVVLRTTEPQFALALVELVYESGVHDIYQLLYALIDGEIELDGLDEPQLARELVSAMRSGLTLHGGEGIVEFRPVEGFAALGRELTEARPVGAEQSNTSIVFDDELILKAFRRVEAGINPELEILRFLTEKGFANIASLGGWYAYSGGPIGATLGILQEFVRGGIDGWGLALDEIGSAPDAFLARLRSLGEVTGTMHTTLASDPTDPAFCPETPSVEALGLLTATVEEEIERVFLDLPEDDERLAPILGRGEEVREQFLAGYFHTVDPSLLPSGQVATERLLAVYELEKAVYELRYELNNRPDWVRIPVAGILRLLEGPVGSTP
ncbi:MAG: maltokinase [Gaiellales bacterium]|nr:maltokinase [Gaiellales bacterium]